MTLNWKSKTITDCLEFKSDNGYENVLSQSTLACPIQTATASHRPRTSRRPSRSPTY